MAEQVPTRPVSVLSIVRSEGFRAGFADARAGRPFAVDCQPEDEQWDYERGWSFARLYPTTALHDSSGRVSHRALMLLGIAFRDRSIL
jgi:hypothetical protein